MYSINRLAFSNLILFSVILSKLMCISAFAPSSNPLNSFALLRIHSAFLLCSVGCHILRQNCSAFLAPGCWVCFRVISPNMLVEFSLLFWNALFCLYFCLYLFSLTSFASTFLVYFLKYCIFCVAFSFLSQHVLIIIFFLFFFFYSFKIFSHQR